MITSKITGKVYDPAEAVFFSNPVQTQRYLEFLGPELFLDILWASEKKRDALVFVWKKCPETKHAKELWDQHLL
jgi:hypothetical protein